MIKTYLNDEKIQETETLKKVLKKIETKEQETNKKIYEFTVDELFNFLSEQSYSYASKIRGFTSKYFDWLVKQGILDKNVFLENRKLSIKNINQEIEKRKGYEFNEDDFKILMLNLSLYRHAQFIIYASYMGIPLADLIGVRINDIDEKNKIVKVKDKYIKVDNEFMKLYDKFKSSNVRQGISRDVDLTTYKDYIIKIRVKGGTDITNDEEFKTHALRQWRYYITSLFNEINTNITLIEIKRMHQMTLFKEWCMDQNDVNKDNIFKHVEKFCQRHKMSVSTFWNENSNVIMKFIENGK